jgi:hypothetical protein
MGERHVTFCLRQDLVSSHRRLRHHAGRRSVCRRCGRTLRWKQGAESCAHCGAHNARNPAWWRDGRFPAWLIAACGLFPVAVSVAWELTPAGVLGGLAATPTGMMTAAACAFALTIGLPIARSRVRRPMNFALRAGLLVSLIAYTVILHEMVVRMR